MRNNLPQNRILPGLFAHGREERNAIFTPGIAVGAASGSVGGITISHNRGGMYIRRRAIPVTSTTERALAQKARLASGSQAWQSLTAGQRLAWQEWANANPAVNALGQNIILTGHQAFTGNHSRLSTAGVATLTDPPISPAPAPLLTIVQDADIGAGDTDLEFTATPLGASERLWLVAAVTNSTAINYVRNISRFIGVSPQAQASPYDNSAQIAAILGTLVVGQTLHMFAYVLDHATGLLAPPLRDDVLVTTT